VSGGFASMNFLGGQKRTKRGWRCGSEGFGFDSVGLIGFVSGALWCAVVRAAGDLVTLCRGSMGETAMPRWKGVRLARGG